MQHLIQTPLITLLTLALPLVASETGWPSWHGPDGGRANDSGDQLVDRLADARVIWESEEHFPDIYHDPQKITHFPITHYCLPVVADGKVFYAWPDTDETSALDQVAIEKVTRGRKWDPSQRTRLERGARTLGTDVVLGIDAATGKTLWKRRFVGQGQSLIYNGNYYAAPVYDDGKVYVLGSWLKVYCLDADSGETIWESELTASRTRWKKAFANWLDTTAQQIVEEFRSGSRKNYKEHCVFRSLNIASPVLAEGVLVCNDAGGDRNGNKKSEIDMPGAVNALVGLDAATGKERWYLKNGIENGATPMVWRHDGRQLIVSPGRGGFICVDPKTGQILWKADVFNGGKWGNNCLSGDVLVTGAGKRKEHGIVAYRLSPEGMELLWKTPPGYESGYGTPGIYKGHVFQYGDGGHNKTKIFCVEIASGEIKAEHGLGKGSICNSVVIADDRVWIRDYDYFIADPASPDLLKPLHDEGNDPERLVREKNGSPSYAGGAIFTRNGNSGGRLVCIDFRKR